MNINQNIFPKGGFKYKDADGAIISGDSWAGVIKRVQNYRQRQGRPVGNVEQEVIAQACQLNPGICFNGNPVYDHAVSKASLKTRILTWFVSMAGIKASEPFSYSTEADSRARANICAGCPRNLALPEGCASCKAAVNESRKNLIGPRFVDARLNACEVLGEDINTTVHLEMHRVEHSDLPGHCWRKRVF